MSRRAVDIEGETLFEWHVFVVDDSRPSGTGRPTYWWAQCQCCGEVRSVAGTKLRKDQVKCRARGGHVRHGHAPLIGGFSPTYNTWASMIRRCYNPRMQGYYRYGGRGITVCDRWREFPNFLADMGERPDGHTLDRVDGDGDYEPGNCRWATPSEQAIEREERARAARIQRH